MLMYETYSPCYLFFIPLRYARRHSRASPRVAERRVGLGSGNVESHDTKDAEEKEEKEEKSAEVSSGMRERMQPEPPISTRSTASPNSGTASGSRQWSLSSGSVVSPKRTSVIMEDDEEDGDGSSSELTKDKKTEADLVQHARDGVDEGARVGTTDSVHELEDQGFETNKEATETAEAQTARDTLVEAARIEHALTERIAVEGEERRARKVAEAEAVQSEKEEEGERKRLDEEKRAQKMLAEAARIERVMVDRIAKRKEERRAANTAAVEAAKATQDEAKQMEAKKDSLKAQEALAEAARIEHALEERIKQEDEDRRARSMADTEAARVASERDDQRVQGEVARVAREQLAAKMQKEGEAARIEQALTLRRQGGEAKDDVGVETATPLSAMTSVEQLEQHVASDDGTEPASTAVSAAPRTEEDEALDRRAEGVQRQVILELISTERSYTRNLQALCEIFVVPLEESLSSGARRGRPQRRSWFGAADSTPTLDKDTLAAVFSNVRNILAINTNLLSDLEEAAAGISSGDTSELDGTAADGEANDRDEGGHEGGSGGGSGGGGSGSAISTAVTQVARVMHTFAPFLSLYSTFVSNYPSSMKVLKRLMAENKKFNKFVVTGLRHTRCNSLDLASLLIMPVQRVPRYKLLVDEIIKHARPHDEAGEATLVRIKDARELIAKVADAINGSVLKRRQAETFLEIQSSFIEPITLIGASRRLIRQGIMYEEVDHDDAPPTSAEIAAHEYRTRIEKKAEQLRGGGGGADHQTLGDEGGQERLRTQEKHNPRLSNKRRSLSFGTGMSVKAAFARELQEARDAAKAEERLLRLTGVVEGGARRQRVTVFLFSDMLLLASGDLDAKTLSVEGTVSLSQRTSCKVRSKSDGRSDHGGDSDSDGDGNSGGGEANLWIDGWTLYMSEAAPPSSSSSSSSSSLSPTSPSPSTPGSTSAAIQSWADAIGECIASVSEASESNPLGFGMQRFGSSRGSSKSIRKTRGSRAKLVRGSQLATRRSRGGDGGGSTSATTF